MIGLYAATLLENIREGRMTKDDALKFMLDHHVHPRVACRLLAAASEKDLTEGTDACTDDE
jgi:hypothetical protein